jgi:ParB family chromosome partitioning protein
MTPQRTGLGKGLDALIPGGMGTSAAAGGVLQVRVNQVVRNPRQPRLDFDAAELADLAASIREHGVIQPLIVAAAADGRYTLIAGERRLQAAQQAGLQSVPVLVRDATSREFLELALVENIQRSDLNALEQAEAYRQLVEEFELSHEAVAKRVGKSRAAVTNTLRLLGLADGVKQALIDGEISEGHARALLALTNVKGQEAALRTIIKSNLNVRQTEDLARKLHGLTQPKKGKPGASAEVVDVERRLRLSLGTKVSLKHGKQGGTVTIHYYSDEELDALLKRLL